MTPNNRSLTAGVVSGALSFAACFLPGGVGSTWAPGLIFGALVLAPSHSGVGRRAPLVVASALVYRGAVWLASTLYMNVQLGTNGAHLPSCTLAGGLGALALAVATSLVTREPAERAATRRSIAFGALAGALLDAYFAFADGDRFVDQAAAFGCFAVWQGSYAALHRLDPWRAFTGLVGARP